MTTPTQKTHAAAPVADRIASTIVAGLLVTFGLVGGMIYWSMTARIDGAIIAPAKFEVEGSRKVVQHLEGGIVAKILVKDGALIEAGQAVIHLDQTAAQAELDIVRDRTVGLLVRRARLEAELADQETFDLPQAVRDQPGDTTLHAVIGNERRLMAAGLEARAASLDLTNRRVAALEAQTQGLQQQIKSANVELDLVKEAWDSLGDLLERQLVQADRVLSLQRDMVRLEGSISDAEARVVSLSAQILETLAQHEQTVATDRGTVAEELSQVQSELQSLQDQAIVLQDRLTRSSIVSPYAGRVLNLAIKAEGAVIAPGEPILEVVPVHENLILKARVEAIDVERINIAQSARIRLTAFNQNTTPELDGQVVSVSADALLDSETGQTFYSAKVEVPPDQMALIDGIDLVPGMPAEVLLSTGDRLAASYLLRPLKDAYARSFRDD